MLLLHGSVYCMELILRFLEIKREVLFRHALSIDVKYSFIDFLEYFDEL